MGTKDFNKPVMLRLSRGRLASFRADNAAEALDYLKRFWSGPRTREYRRAYAICQSALDNLVTAESARAYLVAAAEGAGILYRHGARSHTFARRTPAQASAPANPS